MNKLFQATTQIRCAIWKSNGFRAALELKEFTDLDFVHCTYQLLSGRFAFEFSGHLHRRRTHLSLQKIKFEINDERLRIDAIIDSDNIATKTYAFIPRNWYFATSFSIC